MDVNDDACARFFVYGTLAPGRPNAHVLADVPGTWTPARVRGHLHARGWGASEGYPGIVLDDAGPAVDGFVFASDALPEHWSRLDAFEGAEYRRTDAAAELEDGRRVAVQLYVLAEPAP